MVSARRMSWELADALTEYPPATSVLRSLTFGRLAGTAIAKSLEKSLLGNVKDKVTAML